MEEKNINNKIIIVTGGSRGIGAEIVKQLAKQNYIVILNYCHSEEQAQNIKEELAKEGKQIEIFKADVSKREEVKKLIQFVIEKYKTIDVLINNAGISQTKLFTEITDNEWNKMIQTNLNSVFYCCQEVLPTMIKNKTGNIINISSIWGITGASCEVHYSVTKAGVIGLTKALAKEVGPCNIRVNSIAPGMINTEMNKEYTEEDINKIKEETPLEKIGEPIDITKCIKWLIEDNFTTGQVISLNGGWLI